MKTEKAKKEKRFFKSVSGYKRFLLFFGIYLILFLIVLTGAAEYTSRPSFCPTCHYMETFYQSWRSSAHNNVDCVECHFEPGISGTIRGKLNGLVQIVNYVSLSYKKRKPWAEIPDNTCARSGCHETQQFQDSTYNFKGVQFSHKNHLQELRRGKTLKCTSCHSQIVQGSHIEVTESTCFNCHFKKSDDPEHKYDKLSDCKTCHDWTKKTKEEMSGFRYDHTSVVKNNFDCLNCHSNTVAGNGEVAKERCYQCHFETERLEKYSDTKFMHETHISKHSVKCFTCHAPIQHAVIKMDANQPPDCISCHTNAHTSQVNLYLGENGFKTENSPSAMFLRGVNCKGCHIFHEVDEKGITTTKAGKKSCEKCHGKGFDRLTIEWESATKKRLADINSIYKTASSVISNSKSSRKPQAENLLNEAKHNIKIVELGKSVHNIQFSDKLLTGSYEAIKEALNIIDAKVKIQQFRSSKEFIPNECYSCHLGIEEITVKKFGLRFSHNRHIVQNKISCNKCHSNANRHGELIMTKNSCNSCHHFSAKQDEDCAKCHNLQNQIYSGNFMNASQPDFMKAGGVRCLDCHIERDSKVVKPDKKVCLKCHDNSYVEMAAEWKDDTQKILSELQSLVNKQKGKSLNVEQQTLIAESQKLINVISNNKSIFIHNYDMLTSLMKSKIKKLKQLNE